MKLPKLFPRLVCSAALLWGILHVSLPSAGPVMPGPGGVIEAVRAFLQAMDKGDTEMLDLLVGDDDVRDGLVVVPDASAKMGIRRLNKADEENVSRFFEVSHDGKPLRATDKKDFLVQLRRHVSGSKVNARTLTTTFRTIRADCPSQWCSYAVVEFQRTYSLGGVKRKPVPMQATALVRYVKRKDTEVPHFQVFHWHASPAARKPPAAEVAGQSKKG